ncbi:MAG: hypothetical protein RLZZ324_646 [Candidatus Parcubacteria bacterium]|jgi:L-lactate utilization protein LutC
MDFSAPASRESLDAATAALTANGFTVLVAENGAEAKEKALTLIPQGAQVMTMTSETLKLLGIWTELNDSGKWDSVRARFATMDKARDHREMQRLGAAPEWSVGSVHGVTEDGHVLIASASGSQLAAHVYGADHVLFVVGTQKIVPDMATAERRLREHTFPLEDARALKAYGEHSSINNVLHIYKPRAGRITILFVKEAVGF